MKNFFFIILGWLSIILGIIGIFLPLLPTTIFLILGSYSFMKGSPRLNQKLLDNKYLGPYITNFRENRGMPRKAKASSIILLWSSISFSAFYFTNNLALQILLYIIAISVTVYIVRTKTLNPQSANE